MCRAFFLTSVVLTITATTAVMARAESVAELLEKGIYTEETVGDLDKAISIYQQVIEKSKANEQLAARAQYNIGQCLLKQGKKTEATEAFKSLVSDYPQAKELVAKAKKFLPAWLPPGYAPWPDQPLEPVPWVDGEVLQLNIRMATGMDIGTVIYTSQSAQFEGRKVWQMGSRSFVFIANMNGASRVWADWNTFWPIQSEFKNELLGDCYIKYTDKHADITVVAPDGKTTKKQLDLTHMVYDNEQAMDAIRRLPLKPGYKTTFPDMGELGVGEINIPLEVQGIETIKVPAGEFECFKIHLGLVNQTFWYATDPHRYLVKFHAGGVDADLVSISQNKPGVPRHYENDKVGFSLAAPNDWYFYFAENPLKPLKKNHTTAVWLLDSQAIATGVLFVDKVKDLKGKKDDEILRKWADSGLNEVRKLRKDFKIREDSWQKRTVAGLPALSVVADYTADKGKMVDYFTYILAESEGLKITFSVLVPQDEFDAIRRSFDEIIDSFKVKEP